MNALGHRNGGFTLIELLSYCFVLAIIVNLCVSLSLTVRRTHALGDVAINRMDGLRDVESDFRRAVHTSDTVVESIPGLDLPDVALVLRGTSVNEDTRYALWRMGENDSLIHETYAVRDGTIEITSQRSYPIGITDFVHASGASDTRLVKVVATVDNTGTQNTTPETNTFVARLGGGH
jgi:hypothetical protein